MNTPLGEKLKDIRDTAIAKGLTLLNADEILEENRGVATTDNKPFILHTTVKDKSIKEVREHLLSLAEEGFEEFVLIGVKDGYAQTHWSGIESNFKILGMIEHAKLTKWLAWKDNGE